jgi:hypothetical protein
MSADTPSAGSPETLDVLLERLITQAFVSGQMDAQATELEKWKTGRGGTIRALSTRTYALAQETAQSLRASLAVPPVAESPILAFQAWCERYVTDRGKPLTQDEYFIAQAAFFAAHPGEGPQSSTQSAPPVTEGQTPHPTHALSADGKQCDRCLAVAREIAMRLPCIYQSQVAEEPATLARLRQAFTVGFDAGLHATDKFGEQHDTVDEAWADYLEMADSERGAS